METPPPAWGRRATDNSIARFIGNTPTCVGKTPRHPRTRDLQRKHPHLRGEDFLIPKSKLYQTETPPPAWGRHVFKRSSHPIGRNTPTCVGKTHDLV